MKRILFVVNHAGFFLSHRLPIALAAQRAGYDVHVATPPSKHVPKIVASHLAWHPIDLRRSSVNPFAEMRALWRVYRLYRTLKPDLVHHVTSKPVLYGTIAARVAGVPAVVNAISGTGHVFSGGGVARASLRRLVSAVYRVSLRHPNMRVIFQNREHVAEFVRRKWTAPDHVKLIPGSGVDPEIFTPAEDHDAVPRILLASRLLYSKGVAEFVDAARILRREGINARFVLVGEPDPDNPQSIPASQLQSWHEEGVVDYRGRSEDMPQIFRSAEIFCLPTYYGEGIPKVLVEAAAAALPIVTTDWPGCRDVVRHGFNGFLVPIRDSRAVADALRPLILDAALRGEFGANSRSTITSEFTTESVVRETLSTYRELLRE